MSAVSAPQAFRGERLGLAEHGTGSLSTTGQRLGALVVDSLASGLAAALFVQVTPIPGITAHLPGSWSLVPFVLDYVIGSLVAGRTLGMYLFGLRIVRVDRVAALGPVRTVVRTALLLLLVPAVIWDRDGRGLHDRLTETAVVRG